MKCPKCKKELIFAFRNNMMGYDWYKCTNKECEYWCIPRQFGQRK